MIQIPGVGCVAITIWDRLKTFKKKNSENNEIFEIQSYIFFSIQKMGLFGPFWLTNIDTHLQAACPNEKDAHKHSLRPHSVSGPERNFQIGLTEKINGNCQTPKHKIGLQNK